MRQKYVFLFRNARNVRRIAYICQQKAQFYGRIIRLQPSSHVFRALFQRPRQLTARHVTAVRPTLQVVNPAVWADCGLFQPVRLVQEAWGLRNALDRLPHKEAVAIKKRLNRLYTRPTLSRIMNHQRSIPPTEQAVLLKLFAAAGVPADQVFDRVQPSYDWAARP